MCIFWLDLPVSKWVLLTVERNVICDASHSYSLGHGAYHVAIHITQTYKA